MINETIILEDDPIVFSKATIKYLKEEFQER